MSYPYPYPVHCASCNAVVPTYELHNGDAVEDDDGTFCNEECRTAFNEGREEE